MSDEAALRGHTRAPETDQMLRRVGRSSLRSPNPEGRAAGNRAVRHAEEAMPGGDTRTIYRINERYELQVQRDAPAAVAKVADASKAKG